MHRDYLLLRSQVVKSIRRFFDEQGFHEMHTPRLVGLPGQEPYLDPMWTEVHRADDFSTHRAALITSPEYAMKRILATGLDKIYDLGPCFRDGEPWDGSHDPEFLLLEWYRRDAGLEELMTDTEEMIKHVIDACPTGRYRTSPGLRRTSPPSTPPCLAGRQVLLKERTIKVKNNNSSFWRVLSLRRRDGRRPERFDAALGELPPFRRLTVSAALLQYAGVDLDAILSDRDALASIVVQHGHTVTPADTWDDLFFKIFLSEVEPKLGWSEDRTEWQPTFLYRYPASMAALARRDPSDPRFALRTELYIGDLELANGFAELADKDEQEKRFLEEQELRRSLGKKTWPLDDRFLQALPQMGNAAGIAFGVERLVMLLASAPSISDVLPIPVKERFDPGFVV